MRKIMNFSLILTFSTLFALLIPAYRVGNQIVHNRRIVKDFSYNTRNDQYQRKVPISKMDVSKHYHYFAIYVPAYSQIVSNIIKLPIKIQYFTEENGKKLLAMEIPKGTKILWIPTEEHNEVYFGYGFHSYPTYERGWRYAQPFMLVDQQGEDYKELPYYFVKMKDLEVVLKEAVNSTEIVAEAIKQKNRPLDEYIFNVTRFIDNRFYTKGVFCSPDLLKPIWHLLDTILVSLSVLFLLIARFLCSKHKYADASSLE